MKNFWSNWLAVLMVVFLGVSASADEPVRQKKYEIEFGEWKPVKVTGITQEGAAVFEGQRAEVRVRMRPGQEVIVYPFVCWREARSGILCFGLESRFHVCLEDRVIGLPGEFIGRSACIEVFQRKVAPEDVTKTRDELQAMEVFSARSFLDYKECLDLQEALGLKFVHPTNTSEIKRVSIDAVTLAGEEMTLRVTNHVKTQALATFSARTLKPVKGRVMR